MKTKPLKPYGIRLEPSQRAEAAKLKIDIGELFRNALSRAIYERRAHDRCPTCGVKGCKPK